VVAPFCPLKAVICAYREPMILVLVGLYNKLYDEYCPNVFAPPMCMYVYGQHINHYNVLLQSQSIEINGWCTNPCPKLSSNTVSPYLSCVSQCYDHRCDGARLRHGEARRATYVYIIHSTRSCGKVNLAYATQRQTELTEFHW
jgi:hypothetical protein